MKAITQEKYGVMALTEIEPPVCEPGTVLVRVRAASINARDWHMLRGDPYLARLTMMGARRPRTRIRGTDFAGTVEAVGAGVDRFQPGDEVFGDLGDAHGAFASRVCAPATTIEFKPAGISFAEAAALPLAGSTALMGLRDVGRVRPGSRVLINGASGGVGTYAVQIAKALGAHVTAVCSTRNVDLVRSLGADEVIDYKSQDFAQASAPTAAPSSSAPTAAPSSASSTTVPSSSASTAGPSSASSTTASPSSAPYDVVFDLVGNRSLRDLRRVLAPGGTLVLSGGGTFSGRPTLVGPMKLIIGAQLAARFSRLRMVVLSVPPSRALLAGLRELVEAGRVTSVIDRTYPLAEVPEAVRYMETEHVRAKVVITV
ncbi:NAD(P)-dependent alcohol dehydrogenase [Paractinoplanes lichenicola]|uniref:NAD(P)-dependent alcohol dehydrogenase n=1 Tax=Paractinoplanes lichenicola TaxID=2802976 RepID=A0ABS1VPA2_9ACTN|nr:NAD(P)-dependent alcohol dehydrogenase [Actinoplanes lichenicola]MBL7256553.1 NAD(P)-dependent alcohol dehydrogenase [Actinoplanes lichenicola]